MAQSDEAINAFAACMMQLERQIVELRDENHALRQTIDAVSRSVPNAETLTQLIAETVSSAVIASNKDLKEVAISFNTLKDLLRLQDALTQRHKRRGKK
jgi:predicted  nucleic acid-binding Zn-ribbon protein